ncbi:hypothetical protein [Streptomyces griseosporeus]
MRRRFGRHVLDGADVCAAVLGLLLCHRGQAARALTLQLAFAGGGQWEKARLVEPSAHEEDVRALACQLVDAAGLQRGRLTGVTLRSGDLIDADQVAEQISLDADREARLVAEQAVVSCRVRLLPLTGCGGLRGPAGDGVANGGPWSPRPGPSCVVCRQ